MLTHSKVTIVSMAVLASATATLAHEGLGHGVTALLRGDIPTELTSNHLSAVHADRWVDAAGTLVNLVVGAAVLAFSGACGNRANSRYFFWLLAALNLLPAAGYFVYSGIFGFGDWREIIRGWPHQLALRTGITIFGAALYVWFVRLLAVAVQPFCAERKVYNAVGQLPYFAAGLFSCAAAVFDPLGIKLFFVSTVAAAFGGSSGLRWADYLFAARNIEPSLLVGRQPARWVAATISGIAFIVIVGRGIRFAH